MSLGENMGSTYSYFKMYRLPEFDHADLWSMTRKCVANIKK